MHRTKVGHDTEAESNGIHEGNAGQIAQALGGEAWQSGGNVWVIVLHREDGKVVVLSDDCVGQYRSEEDFEKSEAENTIALH